MLCCVIAIRRGMFVRFSVLWLVLCFLFLGEETSWFQRYLGYSVPIIEKASTQAEFNIHNLALLPGGSAQLLFTLGMLAYFLLIPLVIRARSVRTLAARIGYPNPTLALGVSLWIPIVVSFLPLTSDVEVHHAVAEAREMLFALYVLLYTFTLAIRHTGMFKGWPPLIPAASPGVTSEQSTTP